MNKPKIKFYQFLVGQAQLATGHILKVDKSLYQQEGKVYLIFDSHKEAINYMTKTVTEYPEIECWLENNYGEHIITIDKYGERKFKK